MLTSQLTAQVADPAGGYFDTILGLPLHPLAVHIPVVVLPVAALGLIALVLIRPLRRRFALLTLVGLLIGTAGAFLAAESGEMLAARVGEPEVHAQWGSVLPFVAAGLAVLGGIWLLWARHAAGPRVPRAAPAVTPPTPMRRSQVTPCPCGPATRPTTAPRPRRRPAAATPRCSRRWASSPLWARWR